VLASFEAAIPEVQQKLSEVRKLTQDNPKQQELCSSLESLTLQRISLFRQEISLRKAKPEDTAGQRDIVTKDLAVALERAAIMQEMRDEEQRLLQVRNTASSRFFSLTVAILVITSPRPLSCSPSTTCF